MRIAALTAAALAPVVGLTVAPAQAAVRGSSDPWATWNNGGYILYNNIWGGAGPQSIWANSYGSVRSSFNVTVPNAGAYTSAYDIWADGHAYEIMLWMNKVGPIGSFQTNS